MLIFNRAESTEFSPHYTPKTTRHERHRFNVVDGEAMEYGFHSPFVAHVLMNVTDVG